MEKAGAASQHLAPPTGFADLWKVEIRDKIDSCPARRSISPGVDEKAQSCARDRGQAEERGRGHEAFQAGGRARGRPHLHRPASAAESPPIAAATTSADRAADKSQRWRVGESDRSRVMPQRSRNRARRDQDCPALKSAITGCSTIEVVAIPVTSSSLSRVHRRIERLVGQCIWQLTVTEGPATVS